MRITFTVDVVEDSLDRVFPEPPDLAVEVDGVPVGDAIMPLAVAMTMQVVARTFRAARDAEITKFFADNARRDDEEETTPETLREQLQREADLDLKPRRARRN